MPPAPPHMDVPGPPLSGDPPLRGLVVVTGHPGALLFSQLLGLQYLRRGEKVILVDAANAFDPFLLSNAARAEHLDPHTMLQAVRLSRVYTCHQLEALVTEHVQPAVAALRPQAVLCLGLLDPLDDEDVPQAEAARIFRRLLPALLRLSRHLPVLAACPTRGAPPHRSPRFRAQLQEHAQWHFTLHASPEGVWITRDRPEPGRWLWTSPQASDPGISRR